MANDDDDTNALDPDFVRNFNSLFHKASAEREKRSQKAYEAMLDGKLEKQFGELKSMLLKDDDDDVETPADDVETPDIAPTRRQRSNGAGNSNGGNGQLPPEVTLRLKNAERSAAEAREMAMTHKKEAEEERARNRRTQELQLIERTLAPHVKPSLLQMVTRKVHEENLLRDADDQEKFLWKGQDGELLPFKDGAEYWRKTEFGKEVAPPRDVRGSGGRGPGEGGSPGKPGSFGLAELGDAVMGGKSGNPG